MKWLIIGIIIDVVIQQIIYQIKTKDNSIQGFIEYLKEKYYYKKKD